MRLLLAAFNTAVFFGLVLVSLAAPIHAKQGVISIEDNRLTITATNTPLSEILVEIGNITHIDIFLATEVQPSKVTLTTKNLSLEESFKRILKEYSYAAVFTGSENHWQISTIKIFPKGEHSGNLLPLALTKTKSAASHEKTKTVYITEGREMPFGSGLPKSGTVAPSMAMSSLPQGATIENSPWIVLQQQFSQELIESFQKQLLLKKKIAATSDPERQESLALSYADEIVRYQNMQQAQTNQLESIKRIYNAKDARESAHQAVTGNN